MNNSFLEVMLDEKSSVWVKMYKVLVVLAAIAILIIGFVIAKREGYPVNSWGEVYRKDFGEFIKYFSMAIVFAAAEWISGMLTVNFLNNVQIIREKLELDNK